MSLFLFLTVVQAIVAAALVGIILMQRSEGGGLGIGGGSPGGMMSARGAADFLTRTTRILAIAFVSLSIVLAALAVDFQGGSVESTLERGVVPAAQPDPLAEQALPPAAAPQQDAPAPAASPAQPDPLADATN